MARGHGKGASFEREICKELSLWWTEGERDDVFWRTSTSGARAKTRSKTGGKTFGQYGDTQANDPIGQPLIDTFTFELKIGYQHSSIADVLDKGPKSAIPMWENWVRQVIEDHRNAESLYWALITKRDRREPVIFIPARAYPNLLSKGADLHMAQVKIEISRKFRAFAFSLKRFLELTPPTVIIDICKEWKGSKK